MATTLVAMSTVMISIPVVASADPGSTPGLGPSSTASPSSVVPTSTEPTSADAEPSTSAPSASPATPTPQAGEPNISTATASPDSGSSAPSTTRSSSSVPVTARRLSNSCGDDDLRGPPRRGNGAPIPNSCVGYRTAASAQTNFTNVDQDGTWSFQTDDVDGPISLAFYVVAEFNC